MYTAYEVWLWCTGMFVKAVLKQVRKTPRTSDVTGFGPSSQFSKAVLHTEGLTLAFVWPWRWRHVLPFQLDAQSISFQNCSCWTALLFIIFNCVNALDRSHIQLRICFLSRIGLSWSCSQHFLWPGYHGFFLRCSIIFNYILSKGRASRWRPSGPLDGIGSAAGGPVVACCCMIWMMLICSHGMLHAKEYVEYGDRLCCCASSAIWSRSLCS